VIRAIYLAPVAALLTGAASSPKLLRPLGDADQSRIQEMGCESSFTAGRSVYAFAMNNRIVVRTATGPSVCNIDNRILDGFFDEAKPIVCGGVTLRLQQTARHKGNPEADSVSGPSRLTITRGKLRQILNGESGTAC
jgi:hypothetical protein